MRSGAAQPAPSQPSNSTPPKSRKSHLGAAKTKGGGGARRLGPGKTLKAREETRDVGRATNQEVASPSRKKRESKADKDPREGRIETLKKPQEGGEFGDSVQMEASPPA